MTAADWTVLFWLAAATLFLLLVQRALHRHIQGVVLLLTGNANLAALVHFLVLLPGVIVHELSHWLAAKLLGVRVGPISIGPERKRGKQMRFGSVQIGRADPVRESLIGLAPLIVGTALVLLVAQWAFGLVPTESLTLAEWPRRLLACLRAPDAWLWVYLIFAIANAMMPSAADRLRWRTLALYLGLMLIAAYFLIGFPRGSAVWLLRGLRLLSYLAYAFTLTGTIDVVALAVLLSLEWLVGRLTGRHVEYQG